MRLPESFGLSLRTGRNVEISSASPAPAVALNLVVCLKQVPNPDLQFQINSEGTDIKRDALNYRTNGADEYALEEAVRLKEKHGGRVVALTVGPKRTEQMLREALAKGADEAVRVAFDDPAAFDAMKVARALAAAVKGIPHDLVLTGVQSDDYSNSLTGGLIAGVLGHPHASVVTKVEVSGASLTASRELEGGDIQVVALDLPAVLTVQFGINTPRYAPLPAIMKAARVPIKEIQPAALGIAGWDDLASGYSFRVHRLSVPEAKGHAQMFTGPIPEQAKALARLLREKGFYRG